MSKVLQCCQLSKSYKQGDIETKVLNDLELSVDKGELLAVVGSSGCGKSTFLHLAGALDTPSSGKVFINGIDIHQLSDKERSKFRNQHIVYLSISSFNDGVQCSRKCRYAINDQR